MVGTILNMHGYTFEDVESAKETYKEGIGKRISYLARNPGYTAYFYARKTASMWAENTYSGTFYNYYRNFLEKDSGGIYEDVRVPIDLNLILGKFEVKVQKLGNILKIYQKALILVIFGCSIIVLIQNRKNISNEVILLLTIFIGGFLFHTLWEAKSRYIIPYIVVLIPIASIEINKIKIKGKKNE